MTNKDVQTLDQLVEQLHIAFSTDKVNIDEVRRLMEGYESKPTDWSKYAFFDKNKYTRNLVDKGNGKFNLIVLCWSEGQGSGVHDHTNAHCFMKVLGGQLKETLYGWPTDDKEDHQMDPVGFNYYDLNKVAYINDSIGLHRVENESHTNTAASLHLYCPPFDMCQSFDVRTSHCRKCPVTFYSEMGGKITYKK